MADPRFYENKGPIALGALADAIGARLDDAADRQAGVRDVADIAAASAGQLCFALTTRLLAQRPPGEAFVLVPPALGDEVRAAGAIALMHDQPLAAFAQAALALYPTAGRPAGPHSGIAIDPTAKLGRDVVTEPGVVIGAHAEIGDGTYISANTVIGRGVCIGRNGFIGPNVSIVCALIGDRVTLHAGVRIGTDGFGYAPGPSGHRHIPHLGRVIIQDDVDIGANTCVDRGALTDTTIGEGAKIDNLVQIAHNNTIGRRAILAAQVGTSGSVVIGDWAVLGGQVGVADHVEIGRGARAAAKSGVTKDLVGGRDYAGYPVQPADMWRREVALLRRMTKGHKLRNE